MSFDYDYYASLEANNPPNEVNEAGLVSGFVDECTVWYCRMQQEDKPPQDKAKARQHYMKRVGELGDKDLQLPVELKFEPDFSQLPNPTWLAIDISFTLKSPWYSKDDRPFHVLDNPVRKDRVFGVPFMSAASWKGLLRWACRMQEGLGEHLEQHNMKMDGWKDPSWVVHLFGNEKGEEKDFRPGALVFFPTWFNKVGFEVINPHSRARRAGTQPIYYEVVPAGTKGRLQLLYAPMPGQIENDEVTPADRIRRLIHSIKALVETYGISAKRTAGWGTAQLDRELSKAFFREGGWMDAFIGVNAEMKTYESPPQKFMSLLDENGYPINLLLDKNMTLLSNTQFRKPKGHKPCTAAEFEEFKRWYEKNGEEYRRRLKANTKSKPSLQTKEMRFQTLLDALEKHAHAQKAGDQ